jgi:hypothetical protein
VVGRSHIPADNSPKKLKAIVTVWKEFEIVCRLTLFNDFGVLDG